MSDAPTDPTPNPGPPPEVPQSRSAQPVTITCAICATEWQVPAAWAQLNPPPYYCKQCRDETFATFGA